MMDRPLVGGCQRGKAVVLLVRPGTREDLAYVRQPQPHCQRPKIRFGTAGLPGTAFGTGRREQADHELLFGSETVAVVPLTGLYFISWERYLFLRGLQQNLWVKMGLA